MQTAQQTTEILQVRLLDQVVSMPVVAVQTVQPVEIPQLQFLDKDDMPVVALTGVLVRTCRKLWRCRSCRSSSRNACPSLYNDRCWLVDPDSADALFFDKVVLPVVMQDLFSGLDVQKTVDVPQLQFLTPVVALPVEIPQGAVLDEFFMAVQVAMPVEIPQAEFLDKVFIPVLLCLVPMARQCRKLWSIHSCSSWTRSLFPLLLCLVPMVRQRRNCGEFKVAVLGQGVHACCFGLAPMARQRRKLWSFHSEQFLDKVLPARCCACQGYGPDSAARELHVQFLDKVDMSVVVHRQVPGSAGSFSALHRCESSRAPGVALTPGVELPGVRPPVVHELVASLAHAFRFFHVWTDTCVNVASKTTTTIIQSGEAPF